MWTRLHARLVHRLHISAEQFLWMLSGTQWVLEATGCNQHLKESVYNLMKYPILQMERNLQSVAGTLHE